MPTIFKSEDFKFKEDLSSIENFKIQTADPRLSKIVKSEHLIFDIRLLNPDQFSFPYHFHRHAEELMLIISGSLTLRSPKGLRVLDQGDIIFFEMRESGAHQLYNHTMIPCRYLDIKTHLDNDVCEYPDSNKISVSHYREIFEKGSNVDYFKGEENIKEIWKSLKINEK
jgi:uncharacterized cupin superfamily protein